MKYISLFLFIPLYLAAQPSFNYRYHFNFRAAVLTSIELIDSSVYATGIIADSIYPYRTGVFFAKFSLDGVPEFVKTIEDTSKTYQLWYNNLMLSLDGNLLVSGYATDSIMRALVIKYDLNGDTLFMRKYRSHFYPEDPFLAGYSIAQGKDSNIYVLNWAGNPSGISNAELTITKLDKEGHLIWQKPYGNYLWDEPGFITSIDDYFIIGSVKKNINLTDQNYTSQNHFFAIDSSGQTLWSSSSPINELMDIPHSIVPTQDGGFVVATGLGEEWYANPRTNGLWWKSGYIYKLNPGMETEWAVEFEAPISYHFNKLNKIIAVSDGSGYVAAGMMTEVYSTTDLDFHGWLVKVSEEGDSLWSRKLRFLEEGAVDDLHEIFDLEEMPDGSLLLAGQVEDLSLPTQRQQAWLLKVDAFGCLVPGCHLVNEVKFETPTDAILLLYPNPAKDYLNVFLKDQHVFQRENPYFSIVNSTGQLIKQFTSDSLDEATHILPIEDLSAGAYFLKYLDKEHVLISKPFIVVE
ncbi:MAG: T9SS type A sorting domain-containing protein [Lewinellaceae bacterium]|nr:T9SS type A sorting domain-containing protein [Lewinellaceae bacterium]